MGLAATLAARAAEHAHVLLIETPGELPLFLHADRLVRELGLTLARSPADADVLLVCGALVEGLDDPVEAVWESMAEPRARAQARHPAQVRDAIESAQAELRDTPAQRESARTRSQSPALASDNATSDEEADGEDHDMDDMDMDMDMSPSGIPLASGAEDRDGLEMDVLQLPLGPVLAHWPVGLKLNCTIAGDLVTAATVETLASPARGAEDLLAVHGLASVLSLAGWEAGASLARRAGANLLGGDRKAADDTVRRLQTKLRRHLVLRWMLRGVATLEPAVLQRLDLPPHLRGDAFDRVQILTETVLSRTADEQANGGRLPRNTGGEPALLAALPQLVTGLELASVRLLVASCFPLVGSSAEEPALD